MPTMYDDVNAVCPYFHSSDKRKISCEGITDGCKTVLEFNTQKKRDAHRGIFCDAGYQNCKMYKLLEEKYKE